MIKENYYYKKLAVASMFVAIAVALSPFSIPVGTSRCFPVQHMVNILVAVFLGPIYCIGTAFTTSVIRNIFAMGTLLAFPGSMIGAFLSGILYKKTENIWLAFAGEVFGTGILGGILAYPVASILMGKGVAVFTFVVPFLISTLGGSALAMILVLAMKKNRSFKLFKNTVKE